MSDTITTHVRHDNTSTTRTATIEKFDFDNATREKIISILKRISFIHFLLL